MRDWVVLTVTGRRAGEALAARGIPVGVHIILGLPGEDRADFIRHAERISALPVTTVKLHHLREDIVVDRIFSESPKSMVIAPAWGLKPSQIAISSL